MSYVKVNEETGCWEWQGARQQPGKNPMHPKMLPYGLYNHNKDRGNAHRKSWKIHYGEIPDGMLVMHKCDVPYCCNPEHLKLGTHTDNMRDKIAKGRANRKGKTNPRKLNPELVREIRENKLGATTSELAKAYGVSYLTIKHVQDKISWKKV